MVNGKPFISYLFKKGSETEVAFNRKLADSYKNEFKRILITSLDMDASRAWAEINR